MFSPPPYQHVQHNTVDTVADYHKWIWTQPAVDHSYSDYPSWPNPDEGFSGMGDSTTDCMAECQKLYDPSLPQSSQANVDQCVQNCGSGYTVSPVVRAVYGLFSTAAAVSGAYHGYKRNESVGWAVGWFIFGGLLPMLSVPIMFAEGFAERKH
jgi:hypothetical protein